MVSGISSASSIQYQPRVENESKLTDEQKKTLEDILAKYDSSSITQEQTKALFDELKDSGIKPSKEVKEIIDAAGFKPPEKPQGPPPEESTSSTSSSIPDYLLSFLSKQEDSSVTQADVNTLIKNLQENGEVSQGVLVDKKA
jgi:hypothetical protein